MALETLTLSPSRDGLCVAAFDEAPWPGLILDDEGRLLVANEAALTALGAAIATLARRPLAQAVAGDSRLPELVRLARSGGLVVRQSDVEIWIKGAAALRAEVAAAPLSNGTVLLSLHLETLGARSKRTSDALQSAAGMGRTLAHEIKNPLAGIRGAAQLLASGLEEADAPLARVIVEEVDRIRRLVDRVEVFSEEATHPRSVNIHQVLEKVRTLVANGAGQGIRFRDSYDPSLPLAYADEDQLVQVFLNLVANAAEAAREAADGPGEILIATAYHAGARVWSAKHGRWRATPLEVEIHDNGPGVSPELRSRLFDAFVTTKPRGMGLGLTLVSKLVAAQDGLIEFDSEPGRTVFRVLLPIAPAGRGASR